MSEQTNAQFLTGPTHKPFTLYNQQPKTFQTYSQIQASSTLNGQPKEPKIKTDESDNKRHGYNSGPLGSSTISPLTSSTQMTLQKSKPAFLDGRNMMKSSMIAESEHYSKLAKIELNSISSHSQSTQNTRKTPRMSDHPDMKLSSIEFGGEGYKIPSFLNKDKKVPYSPGIERPESSKEYSNNKQVNMADCSLTNSYGSTRRSSQSNPKMPDFSDPTSEWVKRSMSKKKERMLSINDFEQIKQLGSGKYGKVYLVRQKETNFICAIKILEKGLIKEEQITEQLIRQLKIQTFINHTNLIKMYGFFDDAVNIYIIMESASGGHLYKQLKKHQSMPEVKVAAIMRQVCNAVNELHSHRIIHRDIKPQNIVLQDNVIKLCDFGWSVYCDSALRTTFCGTPLYVGPEILKGKQYDQKIDIWSLGVMMYELLIGENPFKITKEEELIKIIKDDIKIPSYVNLCDESKSFLFSCLQKNPEERMSIRELLNHDFFKKFPEKNDKKLGV